MFRLPRTARCGLTLSAALVTVIIANAPAQTPRFPVEPSVAISLPGVGCQGCAIATSPGVMNASGDFNGDGVEDLVVAVTTNGSGPSSYLVAILGSKGASPTQVATAMPPCTVGSMTVADLNNDKKPDVLLTCAEGYVLSALGNGDGSFAGPVKSVIPALSPNPVPGYIPGNIALADFNSDGLPDLAIATPATSSGPGSLAIALNTGGGQFGTPRSLSTSDLEIDEVGAGDFNGDGKQDLFVGGGSVRSVQGAYLLGNGDGTFSAPQILPDYSFVGPFVVADFNHDGISDVAFISESAALVFVPGNVGGLDIPSVPASSTPFQDLFISHLFAADLIGDGRLSIVAQCAAVGVDATDTLTSDPLNVLVFYSSEANSNSAFSAPISYDTPNFFGIADLNGDGFLDLAGIKVTNGSSLSIAPGNGDGTFAALPNTPASPQSFVTADMNGDGLIDVVAADPYGNLTVFLASGDGRFVAAPSAGLQYLNFSAIEVTADFNGDGKVDVVSVEPGYVSFETGFAFVTDGDFTVYTGNGDGTLTFRRQTALSFYGVRAAVAGDFDGDRKQDLVVLYFEPGYSTSKTTALPQGGAVFLHGNGDGTFSKPVPITLLGNEPLLASVADLNGDGIEDLVIADGSGFVEGYLGNANGTFTPAPQKVAQLPAAMAVADVTGDGKPDLITQVGVYSGNGDGTFSASPVFQFPASTGNAIAGIAVGDLNGDGLPDIGIITNALNIFLNAGNGTFVEDSLTYFAGSGPDHLAFIRLNPNGPATGSKLTLDALASTGGGLTSLLNQANVAPRPAPTVTVSLTGVSSDNGKTFVKSGTQVTVTAQLSTIQLSSTVSTAPTGTVQFYAGESLLGTASLKGSTASITAPITGGGTVTIRAVYSGDTNYLDASGFSSVAVLPFATTVILSPDTVNIFVQESVSLVATVQGFSPTGSVTFFEGTTSLGTANLSDGVTAGLTTSFASAGSFVLTASYGGDANNLAGTSAPITITVLPATTAVTLSASATSVNEQQTLTLTASVQGSSPTGTINFFNGTTSLGTANLSNGTASLTTSFANAGSLSLTASYGGDANNLASTSAAISVTVVAFDFVISGAPGSASVSPGQSAVFTLTVTPGGGFNTPVTFSCSTPLPEGVTCAFNPSSISPVNGQPATTQLTIYTTAPSAALRQPIPGLRNWDPWSGIETAASLCGLFGWFLGRKKLTRTTRKSRAYLLILPAIACVLLLSSCGGGKGKSSPTNPGTPAGSTTITITATASSGQQHTITATLTVN